jgi:8-oxo-dGTP diphosphatase
VLLIERAKPPGQGFWAVPGGKCKPNETALQAAAREAFEETTVVAELVHLIDVYPVRRETYAFDIHCFAGYWKSGEPQRSEEVANFGWFNVEEAKPLNLAPNVLEAITRAALILKL